MMDATAVHVRQLNVLHVEDDRDLFTLTGNLLEPAGVFLTWAEDMAGARRELARNTFDLVLLDHVLPDGNGLAFIEELQWSYPELPVIVVSGRADEALALSCIAKGAANFVLKAELRRDLIPAMEKVLGRRHSWAYSRIVTDRITPWMEPYRPPERDRIQDRFLGRAELFYRDILESMDEGCLVADRDGVVTFANRGMETMCGDDLKHVLGGSLDELFEEKTAENLYRIRKSFKEHRSSQTCRLKGLFRQNCMAGASVAIPVWISCRSIHDESGEYKSCLMIISERRRWDAAGMATIT